MVHVTSGGFPLPLLRWPKATTLTEREVNRFFYLLDEGILHKSCILVYFSGCKIKQFPILGRPYWKLTPKVCLKMIFLFQRWDMLVPWRVFAASQFLTAGKFEVPSSERWRNSKMALILSCPQM